MTSISGKLAGRLEVLRGFLVLFLPLLLVTSLAAWVFLESNRAYREEVVETEAMGRLSLQGRTIELTLANVLSDVRYLSRLQELEAFLDDPGATTRGNLERAFINFSGARQIYDQVRFLDEQGMEQLRVNLVDGRAQPVPQGRLQNKAGRYYFTDAFELGQDQIFISPLDLNIEQGVIEEPIKPMIRFGTPLFDRDGEKRGILLFNYLAKFLLREFMACVEESPGEGYLLNSDGYWLASSIPGESWGFMYPERQGDTFGRRFPDAWAQIAGESEGQFRTPDGLFTFQRMDLVDQMIDFVPGLDADDPGLADARNRYWHLVSFVAKRDGAVAWLAASSWFGLFYGLVILIFALGAYTVARSRMRLEHNVERLDDQVVELQMTRKGLIEAEKMASLGRMVAGFAHEVNTPVGVAVGAVSHLREEVAGCQRLLQQDEVEAEELERHLSAVLAAAELCQGNLRRAAELVRSFKRTSVDQSSESRRRFDMCELVEDTRRALHNRFKNTAIRIEVECADGLQLNGRPGIYSQILTNLLVNSLVHGFGNGEQAGQIRIQLDQPAPDRLRIRFGDDGRGMSAATLGQLFEPFFTTSREQGGSGLGLYICYNLVQVELKGSIQCQSLPGQGTLFTIEHPL